MTDRDALYEDLLDNIIHYQYRLENPWPTPNETQHTRMERYMSDYVFRARVMTLASGIMQIVDRHLDTN